MLSAVGGSPGRKLLFLFDEIIDQSFQLYILFVAEHNRPYVIFLDGLGIEVCVFQCFLVFFYLVLVVVLSLELHTCKEISAKRPKEVWPI